jgi:hypothetical protein
VQIPREVEVGRCRAVRQSCVQHGIPDFGRSAALAAQATERELILSNSMLQFDASDRDGGGVEILESEHRTGPCLHASMVLLDQVVQILRRSQLCALPALPVTRHLAHGTMRRRIAIQRNGTRRLALRSFGPPKEGLGRCDVAVLAQHKVDAPATSIDRPIQVRPFAADLDVRFIDAPRASDRASESVPALLELRHVALNPAHDRRVRYRQSALGHHLHQVPQAQLVSKVPAHAQDDDVALKVPTLEQTVHIRHHLGHVLSPVHEIR